MSLIFNKDWLQQAQFENILAKGNQNSLIMQVMIKKNTWSDTVIMNFQINLLSPNYSPEMINACTQKLQDLDS